MKRVLIFCLLLLLVAVGCAPSCNDDSCTRVLFIGNSYTFVNDLPSTFAELARAGGHPVETGMAAKGGLRLLDHELSSETQKMIQSAQWDIFAIDSSTSYNPFCCSSKLEMVSRVTATGQNSNVIFCFHSLQGHYPNFQTGGSPVFLWTGIIGAKVSLPSLSREL